MFTLPAFSTILSPIEGEAHWWTKKGPLFVWWHNNDPWRGLTTCRHPPFMICNHRWRVAMDFERKETDSHAGLIMRTKINLYVAVFGTHFAVSVTKFGPVLRVESQVFPSLIGDPL